jgi:membrane-bound lytic murein transglycosylase MltF
VALNAAFAERGLEPIELVAADEHLEDEDLLEMVAAEVLPYAVVDEHKAVLWVDILDGLVLRGDLALRERGEIAWAMRKDMPEFLELIDVFVATAKKGTLTGNVIIKRYFANNKWVRNPHASEDRERFQATADLFKTYADRYGFDWLMIAAQGYQESRIDQSVRSPAGAVGIMQLLPATAGDPAVGIADIHEVETNIHAGVKYLRHLTEVYLDDPAIDDFNRTLLGFAAYNAGPGNLRKMRARAREMGLDPNVWFGTVEIAAASIIGRETVDYVANIAKYHDAYRLLYAHAPDSVVQ